LRPGLAPGRGRRRSPRGWTAPTDRARRATRA